MKKQIFASVFFSMLVVCPSPTVAMTQNNQPEKSLIQEIIEGFQGLFAAMDCYKKGDYYDNYNRRIGITTQGETLKLSINYSNGSKKKYLHIYDFSSTYQKLKRLPTSGEFTIDNSDHLQQLRCLIKTYKKNFGSTILDDLPASKILYPDPNIIQKQIAEKSLAVQIIKGFQGLFAAMGYYAIADRHCNYNRPILIVKQGEKIGLFICYFIFCQHSKRFECTIDKLIYNFSSTYQDLKKLVNSEEFTIDNSDHLRLKYLLKLYKANFFNFGSIKPFANKILYPGPNMIINLGK